jgi:hypothetical protein
MKKDDNSWFKTQKETIDVKYDDVTPVVYLPAAVNVNSNSKI